MANTYKEYEESESVRQAQEALKQQNAQKPGAYQSQWQSQLDGYMNQILNRKPFQYDLNGDALFKQYKDQYMTQGKQAMMDTMGQAAAMTGGYGNSYAQTVGQQTYQGYLQGLNDKVPELYNLALSKYQQEGNDLMNQYGLVADRENQDYAKYQDAVNLWGAERDRLQSQYNTERDYDYGKYTGDRNYQYQVDRDAVADAQSKEGNVRAQVEAMLAMGVTPSEDMIAASGLSSEYVTSALDYYKKRMTPSGGGGPVVDKSKLTNEMIEILDSLEGNREAQDKKIELWEHQYGLSPADVEALWAYLDTDEPPKLGGSTTGAFTQPKGTFFVNYIK